MSHGSRCEHERRLCEAHARSCMHLSFQETTWGREAARATVLLIAFADSQTSHAATTYRQTPPQSNAARARSRSAAWPALYGIEPCETLATPTAASAAIPEAGPRCITLT